MFSRFSPTAVIRFSQGGRQTCPTRRQTDRTRARFRLEKLEDRCLLSGVSSITEFSLSSTPAALSGITAGPDGNLWFTDRGASAIGMINPTTHAISLFPVQTAAAWPCGITPGPDGDLWFTEKCADKIGMINPTTHTISEFALPSGLDAPVGITAGPDGNLWFACSASTTIGEINPTTHAVKAYTFSGSLGYAWSITAGSNGDLWFATHSVPDGYVGEINPSTDAISSFALPCEISLNPMSITSGPDGNVWMTSDSNVVAMINPSTDAISEFTIPTAGADPSGITAGPDGNLWFAESGGGKVASINPTTDAITEYPVPYTGADAYAITAGPDGNIWFSDPGTNAIGVAALTTSQLTVTTQRPASVTAGSGFGLTVEAENSSGNLLSTFNGTVTVALATNPSGVTLGGTLTATASNGVATFSGLSLNKAAPGYTLEVSASGLEGATTTAITVTPATATQLVITQQPPASVTAGSGFGLQASIEDAYGNVVTTATNPVSVALANNPTAATLGGTLSVTASNGVAAFSGLTLTKAASGYTLQASSSGLSSATTSAVTVTPAAATRVVITQQQPASVVVNTGFGLQASIEDAYGNVETSASNKVTVVLSNNPTGAKLGGTLSETASKGVATFSGLTLNKVGTGYTLALTSSGLTGATTTPITVTSTGADIVLSAPGGTTPADPLLAPLVLDSPDLWDNVGLKRRSRLT